MLDIVDPGEIYSAHRYATEARRCMGDIWARGNLPIICGGTGLYIDALFGRVELGASGRNEALRAELENKKCEELFAILKKEDPTRAEAIAHKGEQTNKVRLVRAIEIARYAHSESPKVLEKNVWLSDSDPRTFSKEAFGDERSLDTLWFGLRPTPTELRANITKRLHKRLAHGMLEEVARLHSEGLSWERMEKLGLEYRYCARHLQGLISRDEFTTQLEQKIWQYAKRQINWWKRNLDIHWFHPTQVAEMDASALTFLKK
jgi:tRNA dimethylallyltransferase